MARAATRAAPLSAPPQIPKKAHMEAHELYNKCMRSKSREEIVELLGASERCAEIERELDEREAAAVTAKDKALTTKDKMPIEVDDGTQKRRKVD